MILTTGSPLATGRLLCFLPSLKDVILRSESAILCSQVTYFSKDATSSQDGDPSAATHPSGEVAPESSDKPVQTSTDEGPSQADLIAAGYSKRQAAWLKPDPDKHKWFLPRLSRKERGSYGSAEAAEEFAQEIELYPKAPAVPLYNLREVIPEMVQPSSQLFDALCAAREANPRASLEQLAASVGMRVPPIPPPPEGVEAILEWEVRLVLSAAAAGEEHPGNKKAKCRVHLRALQRQYGLSDAALQRIAEIAGRRYAAGTGVLTLTSERSLDREENRKHIRKMLTALIEEGRKFDAIAGSARKHVFQ